LALGGFLPTGDRQVSRLEVNLQARQRQALHRLAGLVQELGAEIQPQVFSLVSLPEPFNRQGSRTAAKVKPPSGRRDQLEGAPDSGLDAPACLSKSLSECLVKLKVE